MPRYEDSVFINAPFDAAYRPIFRAIVFTIHDCGFVARTALESEDSSRVRIDKLYSLIRTSKYSIHDISRAGLDQTSRLARFNMPLELGIVLGAKKYGGSPHRAKKCLILDRERYRYQVFCSDIAGQDIRAHGNRAADAMKAVRNWLATKRRVITPSAKKIIERYATFRRQLPAQAAAANLDFDDLTLPDYTSLVIGWLEENEW